MPALTRGPLPARVYWVRRAMVLGIAFLLVLGIGKILGGGSDASSSGDGQAAQVADVTGSSSGATTLPTSGAPSTTPGGSGHHGKHQGQESKSAKPTLAPPEGTCDGSDIAVTPDVKHPVAGRDVKLVLRLRTIQSEACTWHVSSNAVTVEITSGHDAIWSSRECPGAIPKQDVVVRKDVTAKVDVVWQEARRSGDRCYRDTQWALPGWYHVTAAALAGEPSDVQFELVRPTSATITRTASPRQSPSDSPGESPSSGSSGHPHTSHSPSGTAKPD